MRRRHPAITKIHGELLERDYTQQSWAARFGYSQPTVSRALRLWVTRSVGTPTGITRQILLDISMTVGRAITPVISLAQEDIQHNKKGA